MQTELRNSANISKISYKDRNDFNWYRFFHYLTFSRNFRFCTKNGRVCWICWTFLSTYSCLQNVCSVYSTASVSLQFYKFSLYSINSAFMKPTVNIKNLNFLGEEEISSETVEITIRKIPYISKIKYRFLFQLSVKLKN